VPLSGPGWPRPGTPYQHNLKKPPSPVIHFSMNNVNPQSPEMVQKCLLDNLNFIAGKYALSLHSSSPGQAFQFLIENLCSKLQRPPVILIDEYDAPILAKITQPDLADKIREVLKDFYSALKASEESRGLVFITGITKFTKTSIFSDLNNLVDLTLHDDYADICGFTIAEFDALFQERLEPGLEKLKFKREIDQAATVADLRQKILDWYDGYSWDGFSKVLNPWSLLTFFDRLAFRNFWISSGTSTFFDKLIKDGKFNLNFFKSNNYITEVMNEIDLNTLNTNPLLFQSGYLTIRTDVPPENGKYYLVFPNLEVKDSLATLLLPIDKPSSDPLLMRRQAMVARDALFEKDVAKFQRAFQSFLANFSYRQHIAREAYYHCLLIVAMAMADQYCEAEGLVGDGQFDLHVKAPTGDDFIIEIKYINDPKQTEKALRAALRQIEVKNYVFKFQGAANRIWKTALVINRRTEAFVRFEEAFNWGLEYNLEGFYSVPKPLEEPEKEPND
jgi:hypothetical protein